MSKQVFLAQLRSGLSGLPQEEVEERLTFYREMIDDRMEDGLSEEEAVAEIGPVDKIVSQVIADVPLPRLVKEKMKSPRRLRAWEIVLLILGSPVWLSLLVAAAAILLSIYIVIWAVILSLWAADVSLVAGCLGSVFAGVLLICRGRGTQGLMLFSAGMILAGLSVFLFFGCRAASRGAVLLTRKTTTAMKSGLLRKENAG